MVGLGCGLAGAAPFWFSVQVDRPSAFRFGFAALRPIAVSIRLIVAKRLSFSGPRIAFWMKFGPPWPTVVAQPVVGLVDLRVAAAAGCAAPRPAPGPGSATLMRDLRAVDRRHAAPRRCRRRCRRRPGGTADVRLGCCCCDAAAVLVQRAGRQALGVQVRLRRVAADRGLDPVDRGEPLVLQRAEDRVLDEVRAALADRGAAAGCWPRRSACSAAAGCAAPRPAACGRHRPR